MSRPADPWADPADCGRVSQSQRRYRTSRQELDTGLYSKKSRNQDLKRQGLDFQRANGASSHIIQSFFKLLTISAIDEILPSNRYNMDETGLAIGQRENGLVLGSSQKRIALKKQSGIRCWSTIFKCISALGKSLTPLVLFDGKNVQEQWFPEELGPFRDWKFRQQTEVGPIIKSHSIGFRLSWFQRQNRH